MKKIIAVPTENKTVCPHFGHCEAFALIETEGLAIKSINYVNPPEHQPGTYPKFLAKLGVTAVLAGGMGIKAQQLFEAQNIPVITGVQVADPEELVVSYLNGELEAGSNVCDH